MKRCAVIGMSGNSLFYNKINNFYQLVHEEVGGKGYNQAVAIIRNRANVSYLTAIGNDKNGIILEDFMKKEGIDTYFVRKEKPTLEAKIYVDEWGNNDVQYDQNNVAKLDRNDVINFEEEIKRSDILLLQYEYEKEVIEEAIKIAKKYNKTIIVNPAPMIYEDINLLKDVDYITPNEKEARTLFKISRNDSFKNLVDEEQKYAFKMVINTIGEKGILAVTNKEFKIYEAINVNAIDTTGAGDTFNGVLIASLLNDHSIEESIKRGIIASGIEVTKKYVMDAIPSYDEIEDYKNNSY